MTNPLPPLKNEAFALSCLQKYAENGDLVDKTNGVFAHFPVPQCLGGTEGAYLTWEDHQAQGLLQADDYGLASFFPGHVHRWLRTGDFPACDWFALWDYWERWSSHSSSLAGKKTSHENAGKRTYELGVGLFAMTPEQKAEAGRRGARTQREKGIGMFAPGEHGKALKEKWVSLIDNFVSSASGVARHNKKLGWDPLARRKLDPEL